MMALRKRNAAGFTLLELMIVVGIVAILAALAISGYGFAMVKSRRAAAEGCLQEAAQSLERYYTTNLTYVGAAAPTCSQSNITPTFYAIGPAAGEPTATTFKVQAVPTSKQNDSRCGTLTIDHKGIKTASGTGGVSACW